MTPRLHRMLLVALACGCDGDAVPAAAPEPPSLERIARTAPLPYSNSAALAVPRDGRACTLDSYDVAIVCADRGSEATVRVGREGAGPGELGALGLLIDGPDGGLIYADLTNGRFTTFSADLAFRGSVRVRPPFEPIRVSAAGIEVFVPRRAVGAAIARWSAGGDSLLQRMELQAATGDPAIDTLPATGAVGTPSGGFVVRLGLDHLARFDAGGRFRAVATIPDFGRVLPDERDVERFIEVRKAIFGQAPPAAMVDAYREQPKRPIAAGSTFAVDARDRLWVVSERPSARGSAVEVFRDDRHVGTVEVEGRVLNLELRDSTLVVLVEGADVDANGEHPRRVAWYRVREPGGR